MVIRTAGSLAVGLALCLGFAAPCAALEEVVAAAPGETLRLDLETGAELEIRGTSAGAVAIAGEPGPFGWERYRVEIGRFAGGVRISTSMRGEPVRETPGLSFVIEVPARFDVLLESTGGDVVIEGVEGEIQGRTGGGEVTLSSVEGRIDLVTMGGDVLARDSRLEGTLSTMAGDIDLVDVSGGVRGETAWGTVSSRSARRPEELPVRVEATYGSLDVPQAPAGAELETRGGSIHVGRADGPVTARTDGGDIEVHAAAGSVHAVTDAGDIEVRLVGGAETGARTVELASLDGEVTLVVPESLSMSVEVEILYTRNSSRGYGVIGDLPLEVQESDEWLYEDGELRKRIAARGRVGDGATRVVISTVNGNVTLRRTPED